MMRVLFLLLLITLRGAAFEHFEARHLHPVDLTPDGSRLLAVNSPEGRLSVFFPGDESNTTPLLLSEIPVGLEPVTVRALNNQQAWVVNELSDSVSIVDLLKRAVIHTLSVPDEPADVAFANGHAFISCGRANSIAVYDTATFAWVANIPLGGVFPRALAVSPDGSRIYASFLLSGNNTTTLHFRNAPPQPAPTNPDLPAPPQVGLIVPDTDPRIPYDVIDHDIVEISTTNYEIIRYHGGLGTNIFDIAIGPDHQLWSCASEARNLIRFEPELNGIFAQSQVSITSLDDPITTSSTIDLNPHAPTKFADKGISLAQPMALLSDPLRNSLWLAAFGSDRIAEIDTSANILRRIDLRPASSPPMARGPRGLVKSPALNRLFTYNKLSGTLSVIDLTSHAVISEIAISSHDPMPPEQRHGRALFFDSRLSGNGTVSCGACHFDADNDGIAWDLGDPDGEMLILTGTNLSLGDTEPVDRPVHPMKGPMVTQSLRGIKNAGPFHWRGDKQSIQEFSSSFVKLQAGEEPTSTDMDHVALYLESLRNHPNPNRNLDNSLRPEVHHGNPETGRQHFTKLNVCTKCHEGPRGTNHIIDEFTSVLTQQPVKNSTLEHSYRKIYFTPEKSLTLSGFGFTHDGSGHDLPRGHEYDLDRFERIENAEADVLAYVLSTETDTAPAVGSSLTLIPGDPDPVIFRSVMESQAAAAACDLVIRGTSRSQPIAYLYQPTTGTYRDGSPSSALTFQEILESIGAADAITLLGVIPGAGTQFAIDRDLDGIPDGEEEPPSIGISQFPLSLHWSAPQADWIPEKSTDLVNWKPLLSPANLFPMPIPSAGGPYFRLRRTW